jgi:23S rRNA (pseudouridine1915-N3)-methyltransferase
MKVQLFCIGKTDQDWLREGIGMYEKRIKHYVPFEWIEHVPPGKWSKLSPEQLKQKEGEVILSHMEKASISILLDEKGKTYRSQAFAAFLEKRMNQSPKTILFVIGGAWGFSDAVYKKADQLLSLSPMTFSHQLIRLIFAEQYYRAMTILRNEAYHNE